MIHHLAHLVPLLALALADPPPAPPPAPIDVVAALETAVADAIARAEPSVVAITREKDPDNPETRAVRGLEKDPTVLAIEGGRFEAEDFLALPGNFGSGVVIGDGGEILTVYHLLQGASRIRVRAVDRQEFDAEIIAADPRSDLAVIAPKAIANAPRPKLTPIGIGDARNLRKGSFLVALGNPYNTARDGRASASWGILSNVARRIMATPSVERGERAVQLPLRTQPTLLQLDAKLNLGMSGGAVVNLKGELVGLTTTGGSPEGFDAQAGYAIPMDPLGRRIVEALRQGREVEYGLLGITLDPNGTNRVAGVRPGTPANDVDLRVGDEIIAVGPTPVVDREDLSLAISAVPVGTPVKLKVRRGAEERDLTLTIAKFPPSVGVIATARAESWRGLRVDFASTLLTGFFNDENMRNVARGGVSVVGVETGSAADQAGLKPGQIITEVEGQPVRNPAEFARAVGAKKGPIVLTAEMGPTPHQKLTVK